MAALYAVPPPLNSKSEPPPLFDGTTRLYINVTCPYAQRVWSARNIKGLSEIQIVSIDLKDRPAWYKEKVYPPNKVPALEHNGKVTGESIDLLEYLDNNFEGPKLFPTDPAKKEAATELLKYTDTFIQNLSVALTKPEPEAAQEAGPALDYLENALGKFADGPFLLGQFSVVDIAYGPIFERFQVVFPALKNYDTTAGRPKLLKWIQASQTSLLFALLPIFNGAKINGYVIKMLNHILPGIQELHKIEGYAKTVADPEIIVEIFKARQANSAK